MNDTEVKEDLGDFLAGLSKFMEESKKTMKIGPEIEFPLTLNGIEYKVDPPVRMESDGYKAGQFVAVRSCKEAHGDKTRLGVLVGFVPINVNVALKHPEGNSKEGILSILTRSSNPLIFIPELGESVLGAGSWWGSIKDEKQLREITDEDIQNVWYVKALKQLSDKKEGAV